MTCAVSAASFTHVADNVTIWSKQAVYPFGSTQVDASIMPFNLLVTPDTRFRKVQIYTTIVFEYVFATVKFNLALVSRISAEETRLRRDENSGLSRLLNGRKAQIEERNAGHTSLS